MDYSKIMTMALALMAMPASAENMPAKEMESVLSDSSKVFDIDEVVVVSQPKEAFRLRQQALSSTSLGSYEMLRLGTSDLRDLSQYIPNFVMPHYGSRLSSAMYVRGIGSRVNSPALGIYVDGIPVINKAAFNLHQYQLSRVDVLRGPQGTLYGQNTEGGLVRLYSRDPFHYQGTDVRLSYGSRYYRNVEAAHYTQLGNHAALSVAGFYQGQKGFFRNVTTGERADKFDEAGGKILLKTRLNSGWHIDWLANYQYVDQNGFAYGKLNLSTGRTDAPASTFPGSYRRNHLLTGVHAYYEGSHFDFTSVTSYQYLKDRMLMDQDYLAADYMHILQKQLQNAMTQELTWKSHRPVGGFWHWTIGAFFSYEWLKTDGPVFFDEAMTSQIANAIKSQMPMPNVSMDVKMGAPGRYYTPQCNLGFYHESNLDLTPSLTATLGLRYDYMHTSIQYQSSAYMTMAAKVMGVEATNTLTSLLDGGSKNDFNQLLPKIGLTYRLRQNMGNVYATVSKGYRAGGYNIQMFSDILQSELNANRKQAMRGDYDIPHTAEDYEKVNKTISYKPETSWNYEVGTHLNLFEQALHFDFSAYYMKVSNQQLSVMAGNYGFGRMMVNAGKSHSCGVEAALKGQAINGKMDWALNYGYTRAVFDEYVDGEGEKAVSYKDKRVPYVPAHTMSAMVDYHFSFAKGCLRTITVGANVSGLGNIYWDNANTYQQKFYALLGAHADADFGKWTLSLWGRNLTQTHYNTFAVDNAATGTKEYFAQRGNPLQCGVDVRLHF